jgi:hypothetical protein
MIASSTPCSGDKRMKNAHVTSWLSIRRNGGALLEKRRTFKISSQEVPFRFPQNIVQDAATNCHCLAYLQKSLIFLCLTKRKKKKKKAILAPWRTVCLVGESQTNQPLTTRRQRSLELRSKTSVWLVVKQYAILKILRAPGPHQATSFVKGAGNFAA